MAHIDALWWSQILVKNLHLNGLNLLDVQGKVALASKERGQGRVKILFEVSREFTRC